MQGSLKTLEKSWNNPGKVLERPRSTTEDTDIETVVAICTLFSLSRFKPDVSAALPLLTFSKSTAKNQKHDR